MLLRGIRGVIWDWGDTLMRDMEGQVGPMVAWPRVEAMPGAREILEALSDIPIHCVATNATESGPDQVAGALARVGLGDRLTHFFTSSTLGLRKPDPAFFVAVSRELGVPPGELVSIGNDREKDILPAGAVGMATVLVSPHHRSSCPDGADLVVPGLIHLARLVRDWRRARLIQRPTDAQV